MCDPIIYKTALSIGVFKDFCPSGQKLVKDHITRAKYRLQALDTLFSIGAYADVVRESQEIVELSLKVLLRETNIEVPRIHDVSSIIVEHAPRLLHIGQAEREFLIESSRQLRRDLELAFYGTEDLTPSEFYKKKDAEIAKEMATRVVSIVDGAITLE